MSAVEELLYAAKKNEPLRAGGLVFPAAEVKKTAALMESLPPASKKWFAEQPLVRMLFLGVSDGVETPKSGKQLKEEKHQRRLHEREADEDRA